MSNICYTVIITQTTMQNIHPKIRANALSSYLFIGINWAFLLVKDNEYIANDFVRSHTKTALTIHLLLGLNVLIFVWYNALPYLSLLWYSLGDIIAITLCIIGTATMVLWAYKAHTGQYFSLKKWTPLSAPKQLLDLNGDTRINEKDSLTLILHHIPFIGSYLYGKHAKLKTIQNIATLNIWVTLLTLIIYINGNTSLASLISLLYLIYVAFVWVNLITNHTLILIKSSLLVSPYQLRIIVITSILYLKKYFSKDDFVLFKKLKSDVSHQEELETIRQEKKLQHIPQQQFLQRYHIHIRGYIILAVLGLCIVLGGLSGWWFWMILLWVVSILWHKQHQLAYTTPFIYDILSISQTLFQYIKNIWSQTRDLHNKEENKHTKIDTL